MYIAIARQPSIPTAVTSAATMTKLTAVVPPSRVRSAIPAATVIAHTKTPCGQRRKGARQARIARWPSRAPAANGQPTSTRFCVVSGSPCWTRPDATNSRTTSRSPTRAPRERNIPPGYDRRRETTSSTLRSRERRHGVRLERRRCRPDGRLHLGHPGCPQRLGTTMEAMPETSAETTAAPLAEPLSRAALPVPRDGIAGAAPYGAPQLEVEHALNVNENPYGPSPELAMAIGTAAVEAAIGLNRYPDREALDLRRELGRFLAEESSIPAPAPEAV